MKVTFMRWTMKREDRRPISIEPSRVDVIEHYCDSYGTKGSPQVAIWWDCELTGPEHDSVPAATRIIMRNKQEYLVQGGVEEITDALNANE